MAESTRFLEEPENRSMNEGMILVALLFLLLVGMECFSAWKGW